MKYCITILTLLAAAFLCAAPVAAVTTVQAVPSSVTLAADETATVDLVIDTLPNGLSGGKLTVSLTDGAVADITGVAFPGWASLHFNSDLPADDTVVKVVDMTKQIEAGAENVVFATLTITGVSNGTTSVNVAIEGLDDDAGYPVNEEPTPKPTQVLPSSGGDDDDARPAAVSTRSPTVMPTATPKAQVRERTDVSTPQPTATVIPVPSGAGDTAGENATACETCTLPVIPTPTQSPPGMLVPFLALMGVAAFCMGKR